MAAGAVGGALFGAVGLANVGGLAHVIGHATAGALSGGIGSVIQGDGGNAFQGMLIGGFSAGASEFLGNNVPFLRDSEGGNFADYLSNMTKRAVIGATVGGATSAATGGDFWQGAALGGSTSAIAYTANDWIHSAKDTLARMHQTLVISNVAFKSVMGFEAWDSTAYPFAGTKYGGYSRDGPGEPTSRIDIGTMYHDDAIDRTGTSCANLLNADIRQAHWNLAKWFLGINSFQDGNSRERSTRTLYRIETYRRLE